MQDGKTCALPISTTPGRTGRWWFAAPRSALARGRSRSTAPARSCRCGWRGRRLECGAASSRAPATAARAPDKPGGFGKRMVAASALGLQAEPAVLRDQLEGRNHSGNAFAGLPDVVFLDVGFQARRQEQMADFQRIDGHDPAAGRIDSYRSEEHTSELQSLRHLVCRLL